MRGEAPRSPKGDLAAATQGMLDRMDHRRLVLTALARTLASACASDGPVGPLSLVPLTSELHNAPQQTTLAGVTLQLETYLWRDYQPIAPPDGEPLIAVLRVKSVDGASIPAALQADSTWIINGDLVWATAVHEERPRGTDPRFVEVVARDGPKWGPGIAVDVVVRLRDGAGHEVLLQARAQWINRTD